MAPSQANQIQCPNCGLNFDVLNDFFKTIGACVRIIYNQLNKSQPRKKAMHKIWAQREKQIWAVQENIAALFGSITGIAGKELETAEVL